MKTKPITHHSGQEVIIPAGIFQGRKNKNHRNIFSGYFMILYLPVFLFSLPGFVISQDVQDVQMAGVKIGGVYMINCKHLIIISGHDVIHFSSWHPDSISPSFAIYNNRGVRSAWVTHGKIKGPEAMNYSIINKNDQWACIEKNGNRIICLIVKKKDTITKNYSMLLEVSMDLRLPDGNFFKCTAEQSNLIRLENIKGTIFKNGGTVLSIN